MFRRFMTCVDETPSLRAAQGDMMDRLVQVAAEAMAERAGVSPDDPEPQIAGRALVGLWEVQRAALRRDAESDTSAADVYARAEEEVRTGRATHRHRAVVVLRDGGGRRIP